MLLPKHARANFKFRKMFNVRNLLNYEFSQKKNSTPSEKDGSSKSPRESQKKPN